MKLQMTVRVVEIHAYVDGVLGHGLTHRVTLLSRRADGTIQSTLEMTTADPRLHEMWAKGADYTVTFEPLRAKADTGEHAECRQKPMLMYRRRPRAASGSAPRTGGPASRRP